MHGFPAYVGLGSNLQDPAAQVRAAFDALAGLPRTRLVGRSSLYGSRPMGPVAQPDFCNAVAGLLTELDAATLLAALRTIEQRCGRERSADPHLTLPHPGIAERNFVLRPLCEIAPDLLVPGVGRVVALAAKLSADELWIIG